MKTQFIISATFLLLFISAHLSAAAAPACPVVVSKASGCVNYALGSVKTPPQACCDGLTFLAKTVANVDDKKAICRCLEAGVKNIKGIQDKFLSSIPNACHINVGFPVSLNVNCDAIH